LNEYVFFWSELFLMSASNEHEPGSVPLRLQRERSETHVLHLSIESQETQVMSSAVGWGGLPAG
jgi:hypothetical protein